MGRRFARACEKARETSAGCVSNAHHSGARAIDRTCGHEPQSGDSAETEDERTGPHAVSFVLEKRLNPLGTAL